MVKKSPLDDPENAAHAWARYRQIMKLMMALTVVTVLIALGVLYAFNGALYRRTEHGEAEATLVRDLNDLKFEARIAPYDQRHQRRDRDEVRPWHPLDEQD